MAEAKKMNAVVLPEAEAAKLASGEPQVFADFPGVYAAGVPVHVDDLQLTADEADKMISDLGLPLELTTGGEPTVYPPIWELTGEGVLEPGEAIPILASGTHIASSGEQPSELDGRKEFLEEAAADDAPETQAKAAPTTASGDDK
jgi:hypothetical protein